MKNIEYPVQRCWIVILSLWFVNSFATTITKLIITTGIRGICDELVHMKHVFVERLMSGQNVNQKIGNEKLKRGTKDEKSCSH